MPRFAILSHDHPFVHWDVLFEDGASCLTWRLLSSPELDQTVWPAERIADHRLLYLDYEGPVSGGRGVVSQWDKGDFEWKSRSDHRFVCALDGQKWQGTFQFVLTDTSTWKCERMPD